MGRVTLSSVFRDLSNAANIKALAIFVKEIEPLLGVQNLKKFLFWILEISCEKSRFSPFSNLVDLALNFHPVEFEPQKIFYRGDMANAAIHFLKSNF